MTPVLKVLPVSAAAVDGVTYTATGGNGDGDGGGGDAAVTTTAGVVSGLLVPSGAAGAGPGGGLLIR